MNPRLFFEKNYRISYLCTKDGAEIDLILERPGLPLVLIEVKSSRKTDERDIRTLVAFKKDMKPKTEAYCLSRDPIAKTIDGIHLLPWKEGLREIGLG